MICRPIYSAFCFVFILIFEPLDTARLKQNPSSGPKVPTLLLSNNTQNPPVLIVGEEKRIRGRPRDNVELTCPISCDPPCIFHWTKGNESIVPWDRFYFPSESKSHLQIRSLKPEDTGFYECLGVNGFGSTGAKVKLIVDGDDPSQTNFIKRAPLEGTPPKILMDSLPVGATVNVSRGQNLFLHCEATGHPRPNVTWLKNNLCLLESNDNVSQLMLTNVSDEDAGSYRCEAENEFGISKYEVKVKVEGGSHGSGSYNGAQLLSLTPKNLTLLPGQTGDLTCVVRLEESLSKPLLFWVKKIQRVEEAKKVILHEGNPFEIVNGPEVIQKSTNTYSTTLVFNNVTRGKAGTYICVLVPTHYGEFGFLEAQLSVPMDTAKVETIRQRTAQVQWTLLWTFSFLILSILTIIGFSRLYAYRQNAKAKLLRVSRSLPNKNRNSNTTGVTVPAKSPAGETVSTTLTHHNEIYHPFIYDEASNSNSFSSRYSLRPMAPLPPTPNRKRTYYQRRIGKFTQRLSDSNSMSESDSLYESSSGFRRNSPRSPGYFLYFSGTSRPKSSVHRLHRMTPYSKSSYRHPSVTPVVTDIA